jgi:hypothetical protein
VRDCASWPAPWDVRHCCPVPRPPGGLLPGATRTAVGVGYVRADGAEVSGAQVVIADELELVLIRFVRAHATIVTRLADSPALAGALMCPLRGQGLPSLRLASLRVGVFFFPGPRMRVMPGRVLAHDFLPLPAVSADAEYLSGTTAP